MADGPEPVNQTDTRSDTDPLATATRLHSMGQLAEAENRYRTILADHPGHAGAAFGLGVLAWQDGRTDEAWAYLDTAAKAAPATWVYLCTRGQLEAASGRWVEAAVSFAEVVRLRPASHEGWLGLAGASHRLGDLAPAIEAYRQALALQPDQAEAMNDLGVALAASGRHGEAIQVFRDGLALHDDFLALYNNLGNALVAEGQAEEGGEVLRRALALAPGNAELYFNLGNALAAQAASDEAIRAYMQAIRIEPGHVKAYINLGNTYRAGGNLSEAIAAYRQALTLEPRQHDAFCCASATLLGMGDVDAAIDAAEEALRCRPDSSPAYNNLGNALKDAGRVDEAVAAYRQAVALDPDNTQAHSNLLYTLSFHPDYSDRAILEEARLWAFRVLGGLHPIKPATTSISAPGRRYRIGYVSADFRHHCQALYMLPLLANHDRVRFEIYCYAQLARPDDMSARLARHADVWRPTYGWSDERLAEQIRNDGIDILVDLTMHMANGRQLTFAQQPAPVQLAWLAYPGTTGNPAITYRLSDPWLDPPGAPTDQYSETTVRLADTFWCYDPLCDDLQSSALPAQSNGHITFGCLNNFCKASSASLDSWAQVMAHVPASRLLLLSARGRHRQRVLDVMGARGVEPSRIEFVEYQPRRRYLETYHRIDICLDTLPYNGHTTSLDALWMGVPVVTQVGDTIAGRAGWSQLNNLGMPELAATDSAGLVDIACKLALDIPRLKQMRESLRARMQASALMDAKRFARDLERIYESLTRTPVCV